MPENIKKNKGNGIIKKYVFSIILGLIILFICLVIFALVNLKTPYPKDNTLFQALVSVAASSFISSFVFVFKERKNGLISGLIIGLIILILSFIIFTVFSSFSLNESSILLIPASLVPAAVSGIIAVNIKRK